MLRRHPLVQQWKEHKRRTAPRMQGTEKKALKQLERNRASFDYPKDGFEQKIEFSLIYATLSSPETYPNEVFQKMIDEEDFELYLHTVDGHVSYAQLSAVLAYAAETHRSTASRNYSQEEEPSFEGTGDNNNNNNSQEDISIPQILCKKILKTVVRYAEEHDLDRETELDELLSPVRKVAAERAEKNELRSMIPFYLGYTAALVTGNPLPLLLGTVGMASTSARNEDEWKNMNTIIKETDRKADIERTGLLDEEE